ncbi:MAG: 1-acyl-sn-glycerol-3-phosphate acyltransferase, partial [Actinomycetota bacterium]
MSEPMVSRLRRRAMTVPTMLGATAVAVLGLPVLAPVLTISDLVRGRRRLPRLRTYLFVTQYLINDSVEIVLAPVFWLAAGLGTRLDSAPSLARHRRLQWWSLDLLATRAEQLLGLPVELDEGSEAAIEPGPVIVIGRHASLFDASLAGLVYGRAGYAVRGVVLAELLADPGFDLIYGRLGSVFIPRDDGSAARTAIEAMAHSVRRHDGERAAVVLFPEGRLFRPDVRDRTLTRLAERDPARAERLAGLTNVLPPRPGGLRVLLEAMPEADVVLLDHRGLDDLGTMTDLADVVPVHRPVRISARAMRLAETR